MVYGKTITHS